MTTSGLLAIATQTSHLDRLTTRNIWTVALMTRRRTLVDTSHSHLGATLLANIFGRLTRIFVTDTNAFVSTTTQRLIASQATAERLLSARDGLALLVLAVAVLGRERHTRWASGGRVAAVLHWMATRMTTRARTLASRFLGATRHRRIDNFSATFAVQLIE